VNPTQLKMLTFLEDYIDRNGHGPTYREIMEGTGVWMNSIAKVLKDLKAAGKIDYMPARRRSIRLLTPSDNKISDIKEALECLDAGDFPPDAFVAVVREVLSA